MSASKAGVQSVEVGAVCVVGETKRMHVRYTALLLGYRLPTHSPHFMCSGER